MLFWLRKLAVYLLDPLSLLVLTLLLASVWRRSRIALLTAAVLYFAGITPVADMIVKPLELMVDPAAVNPEVKKVVVLTGGIFERPDPVSSCGCSSIKRLVAGVALCRMLSNCTLIFSGGSLFGKRAGARVYSEVVSMLGRYRYVVEDRSKTTYENAAAVARIVGDEPFYLVTSAYHMPRSVMLFKHLGTRPLPYPSDYLSEDRYTFADFFPRARNVRKVELALHEYLGLVFYLLRGYSS